MSSVSMSAIMSISSSLSISTISSVSSILSILSIFRSLKLNHTFLGPKQLIGSLRSPSSQFRRPKTGIGRHNAHSNSWQVLQKNSPFLSSVLFTFEFFCLFFFLCSIFSLSRVNVASAVNILSSTSTSFGGAQQIDEKLQKQLLAEEENAMKQFKVSTLQM